MSMQRSEIYAKGLSRLIQKATISEKGETDLTKYYEFQDLLREVFPHLFAVCEHEDFNGAMLLKWKGSDRTKAPIMLMNHQDVVEATGAWKYPPFSGEIAEGKVWGRGTMDTKGGLYCMLQAAEELAAEGFVPAGDVYFESSRDEEADGFTANTLSQALCERGIRFGMILDEGGMVMDAPVGDAKGRFAMVGVGEKAYVDLKFIAHSRGGHSSTPDKNTGLVRLARFMTAVEDSNLFRTELSDTVCEMLRRLAPSVSGSLKNVFAHPSAFAPILKREMPKVSPMAGAMLRTTLAFTMAHGSEGYNVLPQEAYVIGNMRCSHHQREEECVKLLREMAKKFDIEVEVLEHGFDSSVTDYRCEAFKRVEKAVEKVFPGVVCVPYIMTGATDARYMARLSDQILRFLPFYATAEQVAGMHALNENVDVSTLTPAVDFYKLIIKEA